MFNYYFLLALRSLKRNMALTVLIIVAIGVGIGASMTALTMFRGMSADPLPQKSSRLFVPGLDSLGPKYHGRNGQYWLLLSYLDAKALIHEHLASRQAIMYFTGSVWTPANPQLQPYQVTTRATSADFFSMFDVPFKFGSAWSAAEDEASAEVVVLSKKLNERVFGGANSINRQLHYDNRDYRVIGVLDAWTPKPRFYQASDAMGGEVEELFLPFSTAIGQHLNPWDNNACPNEFNSTGGWDGFLRSECAWLRLWVELPDAAAAQRFRHFLEGYAAEQQHSGRFAWAPLPKLLNLREVLAYEQPVPDAIRLYSVVSFSFLLVCLINAVGLMLAKFMSRDAEVGVRRALGATRGTIFMQCLIETGVIGAAGGLLGLGLCMWGLAGIRALVVGPAVAYMYIDAGDVLIAVALAVAATLIAGLYPTWRMTQVQPALQLKVN